MIKKISLVGLALITVIAAFTVWSNATAVLDENHPKPRGEMSRIDYMTQVCHVSTDTHMSALLEENGFELDSYCGCFAVKSVQLTSLKDDHGFALGYHTNNVIAQRAFDAGIDKAGVQLPFKSVRPLRKAYKKAYGLSQPKQSDFSKKSMDITASCFMEMKYALANGNRDEGDVASDVRVGKDVFMWANGNRYEGGFVAGERSGKGVFTWANGSRYEGDFITGKLTGKGVYMWANGSRYEGDFVEGEHTGEGVFIWADGSRYEGDFVARNQTGKGVLTWADGSRYEGDFVAGNQMGQGVLTWANGGRYEGAFVAGQQSGKGQLTMPNGDRYEGDMIAGKPMGKGVYTWPEGRRYEGGFVAGKRTGTGVFTQANGQSREGQFVDGVHQADSLTETSFQLSAPHQTNLD